MSEDCEAQDNELLALESIYADSFLSHESSNDRSNEESLKGGDLKVILSLSHPFFLVYSSNITGELDKQIVHYLPPLHLYFTFPKNYPSTSPPEYTLSCKWINRAQLSLLCRRMDSLWEENAGNEIMFTWAQCLKDETFDILGITDSLFLASNFMKRKKSSDLEEKELNHSTYDDSIGAASGGGCKWNKEKLLGKVDPRTVQDIEPNMSLLRVLMEFDEHMRNQVFNSKLFKCKVCFLEKTGSNCIDFWPCHHVYCKECMKSYFEIQIMEGNIKYLKCPEDQCESEANPKQVESLVSFDLYHKWDELLLNSTLSSLGDIQPCPRQHCQYPVTIEDSQGQCPSCAFVFCGLCRFGWHGYEKCKFRNGEAKKTLEKYMNGNVEERSALEDRYGKKYLRVMVEEYLSSTYMDNNAKECPRCRSHIEKFEGCNKMTCKRCNTNFCWLCEKFLDQINPYSHFNNPNSGCFNMLFHGLEDDFFFVEEVGEDDEE